MQLRLSFGARTPDKYMYSVFDQRLHRAQPGIERERKYNKV